MTLLTPGMLFIYRKLQGGVARRAVVKNRRKVWVSRGIADNPSDPHQLCFMLSSRLALPSSSLRALW
eukprot:566822-Pelagomonas_calceolata.AAC.2